MTTATTSSVRMLVAAALGAMLVAAQPPLPPPGVSANCSVPLTRMHTTMEQAWLQWSVHNKPCITRCIPNDGHLSPTPGKVCRSQCCDPDSPWEKDYISQCNVLGGAAIFKDIDLDWDTQKYICKPFLGKPTACTMSTSEIACFPTECNANDLVLVAAAETKTFCATMQKYNLSNCSIVYVAPP